MKNRKRLLALALAALMLMSVLAGCKEGAGGDDAQNPSGGGKDGTSEPPTPQYVYVADFKDVAAEELKVNYIRDAFWSNGKVTLMAGVVTGQETVTEPNGEEWTYDVTEEALLTMNDDGTGLHRLEGYVKPTLPEGTDGNYNVMSLQIDKDGNLWEVLECYINKFEYPEDWDPEAPDAEEKKWDYYVGGEEQFLFRKLDTTGAELLRFDDSGLKSEEDGYFYVENMLPDDSGNLYMTVNGRVIVVSPEGTKLFTLELENNDYWIGNLFKLPNGTVTAYYNGYDPETETSVSQFLPIDLAAKAWGEPMEAPYGAYNFYQGGGEYDMFYQYHDGYYGYKFDTKEATKIFSWIDVGVDSDYIQLIMSTSDGRILAISRDYSTEERKMELVTLSQVESSTLPQKTVLTYGCLYLDYYIRKQIINFNKTNDKYRIQVQDYSEFNTEEDASAGLTKLTVEILAGKVPDILGSSNLPLERFAAKGYLEDLWPYIDGDTRLGGRDALIQPVFNAMTNEEGKLWQVVSNFSVMTLMGPSQLVGDEPGWSFDELYAALGQLPEGADVMGYYYNRESAMQSCCAMCMDDLVDWKTGECKFDGPEFVNILNFVKMFPETINYDNIDYEEVGDEYTRLWTGRQLLTNVYLSDFYGWRRYDVLMRGGTFIGYPTGSGTGSGFSVNGGLAMSSTCKDKEGAWEFIRTFLTSTYQEENIWGFATNKEYFDKQIASAMEPSYYTDENGEEVLNTWSVWAGEEEVGKINANASQEDVDRVKALIEATDKVFEYDNTLYDIIMEQCGAFFAGDKTAEETAKLVQSRVTLYVNEQR